MVRVSQHALRDILPNGTTLFEHWETGRGGKPSLLFIASSPESMGLETGDFILKRRWMPVDEAEVYMEF